VAWHSLMPSERSAFLSRFGSVIYLELMHGEWYLPKLRTSSAPCLTSKLSFSRVRR
jgi:hypothetical protein